MMKGSSLPIILAAIAFLSLGAVATKRRRSCTDCKKYKPSSSQRCCDEDPDPVTPEKGGLCDTCGGFANAGCKGYLYCKILGGDYGKCVPRGYEECDNKKRNKKNAGICEQCGTIAGIQCQPGLYCKITDTDTSDAAGVCVPEKNVGPPQKEKSGLCEVCEGFSGRQCKPGLRCRYEFDAGSCIPRNYTGPGWGYPVKGGICDTCGGFRVNPTQCLDGLECKREDTLVADLPGKCLPSENEPPQKERSGLCEACEGFSGRQCWPGLRCRYEFDGGSCIPRNYTGPGSLYKVKGGICDSCGGFRVNPDQCLDGLECRGDALAYDGPGQCLPSTNVPGHPGKKSGICETCGGYHNIQCSRGLCCRLSDGKNGVCVPKKYGGRGCRHREDGGYCEFCGGFANIQCQRGYRCLITETYPDAGGICVRDDGPRPEKKGRLCKPCEAGRCFPGLRCRYDFHGSHESKKNTCIPRNYTGPGSTSFVKGGICDTCGGLIGKLCLRGLQCVGSQYPDAQGVCLPSNFDNHKCDRRKGEIYTGCGSSCRQSCEYYYNNRVCAAVCEVGCFCPEGQVKNKYGVCVDKKECLKNNRICDRTKGEIYTDCGSSCRQSCEYYYNHRICPTLCEAGCFCPNGQVKNKYGVCVDKKECSKNNQICDPRRGEEYTDCGSSCRESCDYYNKKIFCTLQCEAGCFCPEGKVRWKDTKQCVDKSQCSCE